jgi:hypothetical protein
MPIFFFFYTSTSYLLLLISQIFLKLHTTANYFVCICCCSAAVLGYKTSQALTYTWIKSHTQSTKSCIIGLLIINFLLRGLSHKRAFILTYIYHDRKISVIISAKGDCLKKVFKNKNDQAQLLKNIALVRIRALIRI